MSYWDVYHIKYKYLKEENLRLQQIRAKIIFLIFKSFINNYDFDKDIIILLNDIKYLEPFISDIYNILSLFINVQLKIK